MILLLTLTTHRKAMHRSIRTVIGQTPDNGIARATVGAVDEGIAETAVRRIQKLTAAIAAERNIRRNKRLHLVTGAGIPDHKTILNNTGKRTLFDCFDVRKRRQLLLQAPRELFKKSLRPLHLNQDPGRRIAGKAF